MIYRTIRGCAAVCFIFVLGSARADGNATTQVLGAFNNWTVTESHALPQYKDNIPDGISAWGKTNIPGLTIELRCLTRNVDPEDVPNVAMGLRGALIKKNEHFYTIFSSEDSELRVHMLGLGGQSTSIVLSSRTFSDIFALLNHDEEVKFTIWISARQTKEVYVRGSSKLRSYWEKCGELTS